MIRVTVELISARTGQRSTLGIATICNDVARTVQSSGSLGDYNCQIAGKNGRAWHSTRVVGFPRKRLLAWDLLYRALDNVIGSRNK